MKIYAVEIIVENLEGLFVIYPKELEFKIKYQGDHAVHCTKHEFFH